MNYVRVCTECGEPITSKSLLAKTCSTQCRQKRSRRLKREEREARDHGEQTAAVKLAANQQITDVVREVTKEEIRPVVREAINESVMQAVRDLVGLTPLAVAAMSEDLLSDDPKLRQAAYQTLMKYTIGHQAIGPKPEQESQQLIVNIGLPRPELSGTKKDLGWVGDPEQYEDVEHEELATCDMCSQEFPPSSMVDGSSRCVSCFTSQREEALKMLGEHQ